MSFKTGHDPAACLLADGELVAAAEEERFGRIKHAPDILPWDSVQFCLDTAGISFDRVDHLVFARKTFPSAAATVLANYIRRPPVSSPMAFRRALAHIASQNDGVRQHLRGRAPYQTIFERFGSRPRKVHAFDHHLCHAASAYYMSGFDKASVLTIDGKGEATTCFMGLGQSQRIRELGRMYMPNSLGFLYASMTNFLGFTPNDAEYKVMGLAPYGKPVYDLSPCVQITPRGYRVDPRYALWPHSVGPLSDLFGPPRRPETTIGDRERDLAASVQKALEEAALSLVKRLVSETGVRTLCLAGGVALNVKMNQVIRESGLVDDVFVQPVAGDAGCVLGAAYELYYRQGGTGRWPLRTLYLGPEFSDAEIEATLQSQGVRYTRPSQLEDVVAQRIASGAIAGWFQGRMEFGPRALGSRSILADPRNRASKDIVNERVKFREAFRPFTPSVLEECADQYFVGAGRAPWMIMAFRARPEAANQIPAVVHVDGTVRPQTVSATGNPRYHKLLSAYRRVAGVPVLLNTSFNVRGEPIVCTPGDAVRTFRNANLDIMAIGSFLVERHP